MVLCHDGGVSAGAILAGGVTARVGDVFVRTAVTLGTPLIAQVGPKFIAFSGAGDLGTIDSLAAVATTAATTATPVSVARGALLPCFRPG